jgi:predicted membrane-bound spermidine synthase
MKFHFNSISNSLPAFALGLFALTTQIILFRLVFEFFYGNELTIGISLAIWLSGSALGSFVMPKIMNKFNWQKAFDFLTVTSILVLYFVARSFPLLFNLKPGIYPAVVEAIPILILTIFPAALLCGAYFPYIIIHFHGSSSNSRSENINKVYFQESLGAFTGGLLLNFWLLNSFNNLQILAIVSLILLVFSEYGQLVKWKNTRKRVFKILFFIFVIFIFFNAENLLKQISNHQYAPYQILGEKDTPYGNIKIGEHNDQTLVIRQGKILYAIPDLFSAETHMFLPLLAWPGAEKVLILGGNLYDFLPYLIPFKTIKEVTYLEYEQYLIEFQKSRIKNIDLPFDIRFVKGDIRESFGKSTEKFDVICLNTNEPENLALNRYYTREMYALIEKKLNKNGLFFFSIQSSENFLNPGLCNYINLIKNTLSTAFSNIFIIPGDNNYFFAENSASVDRLPEILKANLKNGSYKTTYINPAYLKYTLSEERLSSYLEQLKACQHAAINSDHNIKGYLYHFTVWGSLSGEVIAKVFRYLDKFWYVIVSLLVISVICFKILSRNNKERQLLWELIVVAGISIALEILILLLYQIIYGSVYSGMAIIFGLYMLGLAAGSHFFLSLAKSTIFRSSRVFYLAFIAIALILYLPMILNRQLYQSVILFGLIKYLFLPFVIFSTSFLTGGFFAYVTHSYYTSENEKMPGITYAADLAGAVPAALLISTFIIPVLGLPFALVIIIATLIIQLF